MDLEKYYHDFPVYNPALLNLPKSVLAKKVSGFKVYSLGRGERPCSLASWSPPKQDSQVPASASLSPFFPLLSPSSDCVQPLPFCHSPSTPGVVLAADSALFPFMLPYVPFLWLRCVCPSALALSEARPSRTGEEPVRDSCPQAPSLRPSCGGPRPGVVARGLGKGDVPGGGTGFPLNMSGASPDFLVGIQGAL